MFLKTMEFEKNNEVKRILSVNKESYRKPKKVGMTDCDLWSQELRKFDKLKKLKLKNVKKKRLLKMKREQPKSSYSIVRTTNSVFKQPKKYSSHGYRRFYNRDYLSSRMERNRSLLKGFVHSQTENVKELKLAGSSKFDSEKMDIIQRYGRGLSFLLKQPETAVVYKNKPEKMLAQDYDRLTFSKTGTIDNFTQYETSGYTNFT